MQQVRNLKSNNLLGRENVSTRLSQAEVGKFVKRPCSLSLADWQFGMQELMWRSFEWRSHKSKRLQKGWSTVSQLQGFCMNGLDTVKGFSMIQSFTAREIRLMRKETETLGETTKIKSQFEREKRQWASLSERQVFAPRTETQVRRPQNDFIWALH